MILPIINLTKPAFLPRIPKGGEVSQVLGAPNFPFFFFFINHEEGPSRRSSKRGRRPFFNPSLILIGKSPFLIDKPSISMGHGFHSYVSLPEGIIYI